MRGLQGSGLAPSARRERHLRPNYWNLVFTALNVFWIVRLLLERRPVKLSDEEQHMWELVFRTMTLRETIKILKLAHGNALLRNRFRTPWRFR